MHPLRPPEPAVHTKYALSPKTHAHSSSVPTESEREKQRSTSRTKPASTGPPYRCTIPETAPCAVTHVGVSWLAGRTHGQTGVRTNKLGRGSGPKNGTTLALGRTLQRVARGLFPVITVHQHNAGDIHMQRDKRVETAWLRMEKLSTGRIGRNGSLLCGQASAS